MALEFTLDGIDQEAFNAAEAEIMELLREAAPSLDARHGTAIRDLLVRPAAQYLALSAERIAALRKTFSLKLVDETPGDADSATVDNLLANLAYVRKAGTKARGSVAFYTDEFKNYYIPEDFTVEDSGQYQYLTNQNWTARTDPVTDPTSEVQLVPVVGEENKYMFVLPMVAAETGSDYAVESGGALTVVSVQIAGITTVEAYTDFTGGAAAEDISAALANLEASLSHRAFESQASITAKLQQDFNSVYAVSAVGYANAAQLRDKHNLMGVAVGNKVDIYVRTFRAPYLILLNKTGTKVSDGVYQFTLTPAEAAGFYSIRSIIATGTTTEGVILAEQPGIGSLEFTVAREAYGLSATFHDFVPENGAIETAFSAWQQALVTISGVPAFVEGGAAVYPDTAVFKTEIYTPPDLLAIQAAVDSAIVRNQEADQVVRGAIPCFISLQATVYRQQSATVDLVAVARALADYINSRDFGASLTVSQLSAIFHSFDITRVALDDKSSAGMRLTGEITAADGTIIEISGDSLDISTVDAPELLISADTVIFTVDPRNIFLNEVIIGA